MLCGQMVKIYKYKVYYGQKKVKLIFILVVISDLDHLRAAETSRKAHEPLTCNWHINSKLFFIATPVEKRLSNNQFYPLC